MSQNKFGRFLSGVLVGIGLGILVAPDKGENTRNELRKSFDKLIEAIKNIDIESTKAALINGLAEIENDLQELDNTSKVNIVKEKAELITKKCDELISVSEKENVSILNDAIKDVKDNTTKLANEVIKELEDTKEETKAIKKSTNKKPRKRKSKN